MRYRRYARKRGMTFRRLLDAAETLQDYSIQITAENMVAQLKKDGEPNSNNDKVRKVDWDKIKQFIEDILPLILLIMTLF